jgi:ABC-type antimicrobial peptide transport system permease subunit
MKTMDAQVGESLFLERLIASMSLLFGALTTLAAVGLQGVMSFTVSRRTREIGIRMALGAERASVRGMVLREVIVLAAAGILLGLPLAFGLSRLVESELFGLASTDPLTIGTAAAVLMGIAILADYLSARRAMRIDPIVALRFE